MCQWNVISIGYDTEICTENVNALDDGGHRGVERGGAAGDGGGDPAQDAVGGVADEDGQGDGADDQREQYGDEGSGGAAA